MSCTAVTSLLFILDPSTIRKWLLFPRNAYRWSVSRIASIEFAGVENPWCRWKNVARLTAACVCKNREWLRSRAGAAQDRGALQRKRGFTAAATRIIAIRSCNTRAFCRGYKELLCGRSFHQQRASGLAHDDLGEKIQLAPPG